MDKAGDTDVGAAQMRGTTEGGGMRAAAWTRQHRRGARHGQEGQAGSTNEGWQTVANGGKWWQTRGWHRQGGRHRQWDGTEGETYLRTCDVTSVCSGVPTGAPWATCAGKHLLGMVRAHMAGKVYKPMTATQKFGQVCPQNIYGTVSCS